MFLVLRLKEGKSDWKIWPVDVGGFQMMVKTLSNDGKMQSPHHASIARVITGYKIAGWSNLSMKIESLKGLNVH